MQCTSELFVVESWSIPRLPSGPGNEGTSISVTRGRRQRSGTGPLEYYGCQHGTVLVVMVGEGKVVGVGVPFSIRHRDLSPHAFVVCDPGRHGNSLGRSSVEGEVRVRNTSTSSTELGEPNQS